MSRGPAYKWVSAAVLCVWGGYPCRFPHSSLSQPQLQVGVSGEPWNDKNSPSLLEQITPDKSLATRPIPEPTSHWNQRSAPPCPPGSPISEGLGMVFRLDPGRPRRAGATSFSASDAHAPLGSGEGDRQEPPRGLPAQPRHWGWGQVPEPAPCSPGLSFFVSARRWIELFKEP